MTGASAGFFGKIPSRGDFVRNGLPSPMVAGLDAWCQDVLPGSRDRLGERWTEAWMEAPIWRFRLPAGACGPDALAGVWLPSTDRAGRLFPLILALFGPCLTTGGAGLDALERIGLAAVERDVSPAEIAAAIGSALSGLPSSAMDAAEGEWWTEGSPRVAPGRRRHDPLPTAAEFAAMLGG